MTKPDDSSIKMQLNKNSHWFIFEDTIHKDKNI
jgi:hypothetical protein